MAVAMAQSLAQSNLGSLDEDMEISSDAGRNYNTDDIDIDIDFEEYRNDANPDENMADEVVDERLPILQNSHDGDDIMVDEDAQEATHDEGTMIDDFVIEDEELHDANVGDLKDAELTEAQEIPQRKTHLVQTSELGQNNDLNVTVNANLDTPPAPSTGNIDVSVGSSAPSIEHPPTNADIKLNETRLEITQAELLSDTATTSHATGEAATETHLVESRTENGEIAESGQQRHKPNEYPEAVNDEQLNSLYIGQENVQEDGAEENWIVEGDDGEIDNVGDDGKEEVVTLAEETHTDLKKSAISASKAVADQRHPVIVVYEDEEIYLIPTSNGDTEKPFFLSEPSLLDAPIQELLMACRNVLGENIDADSELEMDIPDLRLVISEDSFDGTLTQFSKVLEVYVSLCHNDGIEFPDPLYLTLSAKPRFAPRLKELRHASEQGLGLTGMRAINESESADDVEHDIGHSGESDAGDDSYHALSQADEAHVAEFIEKQLVNETANEDPGITKDDSGVESFSEVSKPTLKHAEHEVANATDAQDAASHHLTEGPTSDEGREDELIDFGDPEDDPDLADSGKSSETEIHNRESDAPRHGETELNIDPTEVAGEHSSHDVVHEGLGEHDISYGDLDDRQGTLQGHASSANGLGADEEWFEDEFDDEENDDNNRREEQDETVNANANASENDSRAKDEQEKDDTLAGISSTDLPRPGSKPNPMSANVTLSESKTLSRKRSRENADLEYESVDDSIEAKKARPT